MCGGYDVLLQPVHRQYLYGCKGGSQGVEAGTQVGCDGNLREIAGRDGLTDAHKLCDARWGWACVVPSCVMLSCHAPAKAREMRVMRTRKKRVNARYSLAL